MKIFFAGPLTNLNNPQKTKAFYKALAEVASEEGFDWFLAFLNGTDPIKNPDIKPNDVYSIDTSHLRQSDVVVAYVGEPSTGTGIEIEYARACNIPVVLLVEKGKTVSRMLLGSIGIQKKISFISQEDCLIQLRTYLQEIKQKYFERRNV